MRLHVRNLHWLSLALLVVALDHGVKWLASTHLVYATPKVILPVFNLTLLHNTGAAFSFLAAAGGWQRWAFASLAVLVVAVLLFWLLRLPQAGWRLAKAGIVLVIGGAVGNLIDRLMTGYVVDFIQVHYQQYYFPAFNVADSAITIGVFLLILAEWRKPKPETSAE